MFASLPQQPPPTPPATTQNMFYLPHQPSPLSPRSSNVQSPRPIFSMSPSQSKSSPSEQNISTPRRERNTATTNQRPTSSYAQRYAERISNPAANISRRRAAAAAAGSSSPTTPTRTTPFSASSRQPTSSSASSTSPRDKRRDVFLNRVKRDREEGRFEARAEQILRMEYLAQRRKYEEAMARSAPNLEAVVEEEDVDVDVDGDEGMGGVWDEADELDHFLAQDTDYDALLERLEREEGEDRDRGMGGAEASSFDEEADYDSIFMDMLSSQDAVGESPQLSQSMDTSGG